MISELEKKISILGALGKHLITADEELQKVMEEAKVRNPWFTINNIEKSIQEIAQNYLNTKNLSQFIASYNLPHTHVQRVGIVMAGNIPMVGFHDMLCVFLAGHHAIIKPSDKDFVLIEYIIKLIGRLAPEYASHFSVVSQLKYFDAVIATGSNNTSTYFKKYFENCPHIIRQNRNAVAILSGNETRKDLFDLGQDIFLYFGLGCRNVSKIYVPDGYNFTPLMEELHKYNNIIHHHKYKNNFDYNLALYMLNRNKYFNNGCITLVENDLIPSRISSCHYNYYNDTETLVNTLQKEMDQVQCIVSTIDDLPFTTFNFGEAQKPKLDDFADGIDTMKFLEKI